MINADIDIDTHSKFDPKDYFECVYASRYDKQKLIKHPVGVYFQNIPTDPVSKLSAIPYDIADNYDYFKIDMLHLSILDNFESKKQIRDLLKIEPDWELLKYHDVVEQLFQLSKHYDIINRIKPKSIEELADCLAIIRPGKRKYLDKYVNDRDNIRRFLYIKESESDFKLSHAIAYAHIIVLQLHTIKNKTSKDLYL
jgi:hypothetical protein